MKKFKKITILFTVILLMLCSVVPNKDERADAFAITGTALAIGAIATIIVGGAVVSPALTEQFGTDIIDYVTETGEDISDFLNYNNRTKILNLMTSVAVVDAFRKAASDRAEIIESSKGLISNSITSIPVSRGYQFTSIPFNLSSMKTLELVKRNGIYTMSININEPLLNNVTVGLYYLNAAGTNLVGKLMRLKKGDVGTKTYRGQISSSVAVVDDPQTYSHNAVYMMAQADYPYANTDFALNFTNIGLTYNDLAVPVDIADQFGNIATDTTELQDTINSHISVGTEYGYSIPEDITTVKKISTITTYTNVADMDIPIEDAPSGVFAILYNIFNLLRNIPSRVANAFVGLFEFVVAAIASLSDNLSSMFESLMNSISSIISAIYSIGGTLWDTSGNITSAIYSSLNSTMDMLVNIIDVVGSGLGSLGETITTALANGIDNINDFNDNLWEDAGLVWSGLTTAIDNLSVSVGDMTSPALGGIDELLNDVGGFFADLADRLSVGIDNIRDFTATNATAIGNNIATGIDNIKTFTSTNTARIGDNIQTAATSITDTITGIAVPSTSAIDDYKQRITDMNNKLKKKFEFIMLPIESLKNLYSKPKSLFDVEMVLLDTKVRILPDSFRGSVAYIKPLLNGVIVLLTFMSIYKKIQGKEVV